jgi:hypothetical protein
MVICIIAGCVASVSVQAYAHYKYRNRPDEFCEFTNAILSVEGIEEISTYVEETNGQSNLSTLSTPMDTSPLKAMLENIGTGTKSPNSDIMDVARKICDQYPTLGNQEAIAGNQPTSPNTLVGIKTSDGNISNATSVYIRDKTRVTNHRRVMYRNRNNFTRALVAHVKLSIDWETRDAANEKVARKMIKDAMAEHGLSITDSVRTLPIAIEAVFLPNDAEIYANEWRHSRAAKKRIARYYAPEDNGNTGYIQWLWSQCNGRTSDMQDGGRLNTMDQPFKTPLSLKPNVSRSSAVVNRPRALD